MMAFRLNNLPKILYSERDRDRQREKQKQERALMLHNDEKDIIPVAQDLFHAPVKVDPSLEDRTTLEIRHTLGNFESVRHYMVDDVSGRNLIGVDQHFNHLSVQSSLRPFPRTLQPSSGTSKLSTTQPNRNYPVASTGTSSLPSSSNLPQSSSKLSHHQKVQPSQNQLPIHLSEPSGNNCALNSVNVPHGDLSSSKKSNAYNFVTADKNSVSVHTGAVPTPLLPDKKVNTHSAGSVSVQNPNDENERGISFKKQVDSQLELESILKEMMDVTAPLTGIQTPAKDSIAKKYTPRRISKSEEEIVQSIREGLRNIPSPIKKMDSSESSSSDSESTDSEDSSSGSQGGLGTDNPDPPPPTTDSPTRWNLSSFIRKDNVKETPGPDSSGAGGGVKSPKDGSTRDNTHTSSTLNLQESPKFPVKVEPNVTSTSVHEKSRSPSPEIDKKSTLRSSSNSHLSHPNVTEAQSTKVLGKSPRKTLDVKKEVLIPVKPPASSIPRKGPPVRVSKVACPSDTSSEDEDREPIKNSRSSLTVKSRTRRVTSGAKRKRPRRSSSSEPPLLNSDDDDRSPEAEKTTQVVQDRNKSDTIRKLFRPSKKKDKVESSSVKIEASNVNSNVSANNNCGYGKGSASNRVSGKDSGRKNNLSSSVSVQNEDVDLKTRGTNNSAGAITAGKKRKSVGTESKLSHTMQHHHSRKHSQRQHSGSSVTSLSEGSATAMNSNLFSAIVSPSKNDPLGKLHPSSLMCRIPLVKLLRAPGPPATTTNPLCNSLRSVKEADDGLVASHESVGPRDSTRCLRLPDDSSRVGSSKDHASNTTYDDPVINRPKDESVCSDSDHLSSTKVHPSPKRLKKKPKSPKKTCKVKHKPDSHSQIDEGSSVACGEVSSNVFGYTACDSALVSTTRTPPVELDIAQAPDSSLNPPHLPSPVAPLQPIYYSYFEGNETQHHEQYYSRDQDTYLEEAKRLKHKADSEKVSTNQASAYLEAGLYFILTGLLMERDRAVGSQSAFTMYKDTLSLIRYIGARFRSGRAEYSNAMEAKIIVLSMRCESLLSLKLFKIKMRETKDVTQYLTEQFAKAPPVEALPIPNSPQLSTPSPRSPTSSPAGSSGTIPGLNPSPHPRQNHHVTTVSRSVYAQVYKQCVSTMNLINAHELWDSADNLVERYHMEEFFISIDRQYGPLTLHTSLGDLVRYVKHCLKVLKICSEI